MSSLARLVAEDPTLVIDRTGGHTVLRGLGDTHVAVAVERLARVFGVHVTTSPAPVAYRETIAGNAQVEGKLKKQSGGHGQFAVVQLRVSPLPPGGGFEFVDSVVGGSVPRTYIPAVEKGARDALAAGRSAGASGRRRARRALRRQVALGRLVRDGVPHGRVDRASRPRSPRRAP